MRRWLSTALTIGILAAAIAAHGAEPSGAAYVVNASNDPLILSFLDLKGELSFSLYLKTDGNPTDAPWDLYHVYAGTPDEQGKQIQRIAFNTGYSGWVYMTLTDPVLEGDVTLRFFIDDFAPDSHPRASLRNFSSAAAYVSGGSAGSEPAALLPPELGKAGMARLEAGYARP